MILTILLALGLVVVVGAALALVAFQQLRRLRRQGYRYRRKLPSSDARHTFDPSRSVSFRGGSRVGLRNATVPLVELRFDERWAHLSGALPALRGPLPVLVDRSVVTRVHRITRRGVRFQASDGRYDGVIFWTRQPDQVLAALHHYGWPVG